MHIIDELFDNTDAIPIDFDFDSFNEKRINMIQESRLMEWQAILKANQTILNT